MEVQKIIIYLVLLYYGALKAYTNLDSLFTILGSLSIYDGVKDTRVILPLDLAS